MTTAIEVLEDHDEAHPQFVGLAEPAIVVNWPGDDRRLADLNVFFVHTPGP